MIIMDHIQRVQQMDLDYVYLGYWVKGSARMSYKIRYRPIEVLGPHGWHLMAEKDPVVRRTPEVAGQSG